MTERIINDILAYIIIAMLMSTVMFVGWLLRHNRATRRIRIYVIICSFTISSIILGFAAHLRWIQIIGLMLLFNISSIICYFFVMEPLNRFLNKHSGENETK